MTRDTSPRLVGRYALFGEIASGGMAAVHLGRLHGPVGFARLVAIKRLHSHFARDPEFVTMFLDEARLAARIRHPNVVQTLDVVAAEGELFLVMDYIEGESLSRLLAAHVRAHGHPPPPRIVAAILAGALHGLHAAHEAKDERGELLGVVHRDVSPQNILVGADGVPRVLDFGIAKAIRRAQVTQAGQLKGKLAYMAPEQIRFDRKVSRRTDVYASAVVLWECLTGSRLFSGDEAEIVSKIFEGKVPPPSELEPGVPSALDAVVARGLLHDPEARFETAREMALAIERAVGLASATEVADWVASTAAPALAQRSRLARDVESDEAAPPGPSPAAPPPDEATTRVAASARTAAPSAARRATTVAIGVGVLAVGALMLRTVSARPRPATADTGISAVAASMVPISPPEPSAEPEIPPPSVSAATAEPSQSQRPATAGHLPRPKPSASANPCEPPFYFDADGLKRYKRGCVR